MSDETVNGWTNRETWLVALWLNNDQGLQEQAQACNTDGEMLQEAATSLEEWVRDVLCDGAAGELSGFAADLFEAALDRVEWREVAQSFREE
jgi:hypothetical protein